MQAACLATKSRVGGEHDMRFDVKVWPCHWQGVFQVNLDGPSLVLGIPWLLLFLLPFFLHFLCHEARVWHEM